MALEGNNLNWNPWEPGLYLRFGHIHSGKDGHFNDSPRVIDSYLQWQVEEL